MLPFLDEKKPSPSVVVNRKKDGGLESEDTAGLHAAAEDLISAVHSKSVEAVASALRAAFDICGSSDDSSLFDSGE